MSIQYASIGERHHTGNVKWDLQGPLPFGVADMDIQSPPCLTAALRQRLRHPFFGYAYMTDSLRGAIVDYLRQRHGVTASPEWLCDLPGCVSAFTLVARTICGPAGPAHAARPADITGLTGSPGSMEHTPATIPGGSVASLMVCTPAYPPMLHCHEDAGCELITVPLAAQSNGRATFDWDAMERAVRPDTRLFLLCNPHNPLGRSFSREELLRLGDFCCRHDLILCADEIHGDLVLAPQAHHTCALTLPSEICERTVLLSAPSKTFNIAGIGFTFMAVPNPKLREQILRAKGHSLPPTNVFAHAAAEACYREGWDWHRELIEALRSNCRLATAYIATHMPMLRLQHHEATYLLWIDCSALCLDSPHHFFREQAGVYLDDGKNFGAPQCVRLNFACSPEMLRQGLESMASAIASLKNV